MPRSPFTPYPRKSQHSCPHSYSISPWPIPLAPLIVRTDPKCPNGSSDPVNPLLLGLVGLATKHARNSWGMLGEPPLHHGDGPLPIKRMGVEAVVFRPGCLDVLDQFFPAAPRAPLQVVELKRFEQRLRLVQPRGVRRQQSRTPPVPALGQVDRRTIP